MSRWLVALFDASAHFCDSSAADSAASRRGAERSVRTTAPSSVLSARTTTTSSGEASSPFSSRCSCSSSRSTSLATLASTAPPSVTSSGDDASRTTMRMRRSYFDRNSSTSPATTTTAVSADSALKSSSALTAVKPGPARALKLLRSTTPSSDGESDSPVHHGLTEVSVLVARRCLPISLSAKEAPKILLHMASETELPSGSNTPMALTLCPSEAAFSLIFFSS